MHTTDDPQNTKQLYSVLLFPLICTGTNRDEQFNELTICHIFHLICGFPSLIPISDRSIVIRNIQRWGHFSWGLHSGGVHRCGRGSSCVHELSLRESPPVLYLIAAGIQQSRSNFAPRGGSVGAWTSFGCYQVICLRLQRFDCGIIRSPYFLQSYPPPGGTIAKWCLSWAAPFDFVLKDNVFFDQHTLILFECMSYYMSTCTDDVVLIRDGTSSNEN